MEDATEELFKRGFGLARGRRRICEKIGVKSLGEGIVSNAKVELKKCVALL